MRRVWHWASWLVLVGIVVFALIGAYMKDGLGPLVFGLVVVGAVLGVIDSGA